MNKRIRRKKAKRILQGTAMLASLSAIATKTGDVARAMRYQADATVALARAMALLR